MLHEIVSDKIDHLSRTEWWDGSRAPFVEALLDQSGLNRSEIEDALEFLDQYVRSVPEVLGAIVDAAGEAGLTERLQPLLEAIAGYWELADDHIPDSLGLVGLADDAYLSFRLLERFVDECRWATGQGLLPTDLSDVNRVMRRLLGTELSERLDADVEATFERAQLRSAARVLSRWRSGLPVKRALPIPTSTPSAPVVPAAIRLPARPEGRGEDAAPSPSPLSLGQTVRGNVSVLALGIGVGLFYLWQRYFQFPSSAEVRLLGWEGIELGWLVGLRNLILGSLGLSTLIAAGNIKKLIGEFYRPLKHLEGLELKKFYASWGTMIFSLAALALFLAVCATNVTVRLGAQPRDFELVAFVDGGGDAFLLTLPAGADEGEPRVGDEATLGGPDVVRLGLRGLGARAVLLIRDKYNLVTVEAFRVERRPWWVRFSPLELKFRLPKGATTPERNLLTPDPDVVRGRTLHQATRWTFEVRQPFRFARGIPNRVTGESGAIYGPLGGKHLYFSAPGDGTPCPGRASLSEPEVQLFWDELCTERPAVGRWTRESSFFDVPDVGMVAVDLRQHRVLVRYVRGELVFEKGQPPLATKEAVKLEAVYRRRSGSSVPAGAGQGGSPGAVEPAVIGGS